MQRSKNLIILISSFILLTNIGCNKDDNGSDSPINPNEIPVGTLSAEIDGKKFLSSTATIIKTEFSSFFAFRATMNLNSNQEMKLSIDTYPNFDIKNTNYTFSDIPICIMNSSTTFDVCGSFNLNDPNENKLYTTLVQGGELSIDFLQADVEVGGKMIGSFSGVMNVYVDGNYSGNTVDLKNGVFNLEIH